MKPKNTERKKIKSNSSQSFPYLICSFILFHQNKRQKHTYHVKRFHSCSNGQELTLTKPLTHTHTVTRQFFILQLARPILPPFPHTPRKWRYKCTQKNDSTLFCVCRESERARQLGCLLFGWQSFLGVIKRNEKKQKSIVLRENYLHIETRNSHSHTHVLTLKRKSCKNHRLTNTQTHSPRHTGSEQKKNNSRERNLQTKRENRQQQQ